jgi:hypothetical protein
MMRTTPVVPPERLRRAAFAPLWAMAVLLPLLSLLGGAWWSWRLVQAEARTRIERTTLTLREHAQRAFETQDALLAAVQRLTDGMTWEEIAASAEVAAFLPARPRRRDAGRGRHRHDPPGWRHGECQQPSLPR